MIGFLLASMVSWLCMGLGSRVLRRLDLNPSPAERFAYGGAIGLGVFSYSILTLGLLHQFNLLLLLPVIVIAVLGLPDCLALLRARTRRQGDKETRGQGDHSPLTAHQLGLRILIACLLLLSLLLVLLPPDANDWDGLAYHLAVPKLYLQKGGIYFIPFIHHSNFPALLEMLYLWGLWAAGVSCAKAFHWWMWLLTLIGTGAFVTQLQRAQSANGQMGKSGSRQSAVGSEGKSEIRNPKSAIGEWAILMLAATPLAIWESGVAYVDLSTALYTALGAFAIYRGLLEKATGWLWVGSILMGFALGTKYTALLSWGLLGLLALIWLWHIRWREGLRTLLSAGALALLIGSPWYLKTYLYTGNPVYPFAYEIFGARNWSQENAEAYRADQLKFGLGRTPTHLLMLPWNLTAHPESFMDPIGVLIGDRVFSLGDAGPSYLAGLFLMNTGGLPAGAIWLGLFVLGSTVGWFYLAQQVRYLIPVFPVLAALTAWSHARAIRFLQSLFATLLLLQSGFCLWLFSATLLPSLPVALGWGDREAYLREKLPIYPALEFINHRTPKNARIVLYDEVRGFYLDRDYLWGNPGHHTLIPYSAFQSAKELVGFLKGQGYTHALINRHFWVRSQEKWREQIEEAIYNGLLQLVFEERGVEVYEIRDFKDDERAEVFGGLVALTPRTLGVAMEGEARRLKCRKKLYIKVHKVGGQSRGATTLRPTASFVNDCSSGRARLLPSPNPPRRGRRGSRDARPPQEELMQTLNHHKGGR